MISDGSRRSIRMPGWDYRSAGAYFVTLVATRRLLFRRVAGGVMALSPWGRIVHEEWLSSAAIRREIRLDEFVVMPNHVHGIVWILKGAQSVGGSEGARPAPPQRAPRSLGAVVGGFKSSVTKKINQVSQNSNAPIWQRNYYERVIRDESELERARIYILHNPGRWAEDAENPDNARSCGKKKGAHL